MEILLYTTPDGSEFQFSDQFKEEFTRRVNSTDYIHDGDAAFMRQNPICIAIVQEKGSEWCSVAECSVRVEVIPEVLRPYLSVRAGQVEMFNWDITTGDDGREEMDFFDLLPSIHAALLWEMLEKTTMEEIDQVRAKVAAIYKVIGMEVSSHLTHLTHLNPPSTTHEDDNGLNVGSYYSRCA